MLFFGLYLNFVKVISSKGSCFTFCEVRNLLL